MVKNCMLFLGLHAWIANDVHNWDKFGAGTGYGTESRGLAEPKGGDKSTDAFNTGIAIGSRAGNELIRIALPTQTL